MTITYADNFFTSLEEPLRCRKLTCEAIIRYVSRLDISSENYLPQQFRNFAFAGYTAWSLAAVWLNGKESLPENIETYRTFINEKLRVAEKIINEQDVFSDVNATKELKNIINQILEYTVKYDPNLNKSQIAQGGSSIRPVSESMARQIKESLDEKVKGAFVWVNVANPAHPAKNKSYHNPAIIFPKELQNKFEQLAIDLGYGNKSRAFGGKFHVTLMEWSSMAPRFHNRVKTLFEDIKRSYSKSSQQLAPEYGVTFDGLDFEFKVTDSIEVWAPRRAIVSGALMVNLEPTEKTKELMAELTIPLEDGDIEYFQERNPELEEHRIAQLRETKKISFLHYMKLVNKEYTFHTTIADRRTQKLDLSLILKGSDITTYVQNRAHANDENDHFATTLKKCTKNRSKANDIVPVGSAAHFASPSKIPKTVSPPQSQRLTASQ